MAIRRPSEFSQPPLTTADLQSEFGGTWLVHSQALESIYFRVPQRLIGDRDPFISLSIGGQLGGIVSVVFPSSSFEPSTTITLSALLSQLPGWWVITRDNSDGKLSLDVGPDKISAFSLKSLATQLRSRLATELALFSPSPEVKQASSAMSKRVQQQQEALVQSTKGDPSQEESSNFIRVQFAARGLEPPNEGKGKGDPFFPENPVLPIPEPK